MTCKSPQARSAMRTIGGDPFVKGSLPNPLPKIFDKFFLFGSLPPKNIKSLWKSAQNLSSGKASSGGTHCGNALNSDLSGQFNLRIYKHTKALQKP